jgi:hypothetical protein
VQFALVVERESAQRSWCWAPFPHEELTGARKRLRDDGRQVMAAAEYGSHLEDGYRAVRAQREPGVVGTEGERAWWRVELSSG